MTRRIKSKVLLGFTLVELLVVISIIALLLAMLLPSLNKARQTAVTLQCAAKQHSIGTAYMLYQTEYNGYLPAYGGNGSPWHWALLQPYLYPGSSSPYGTQVLVCPTTRTEWDIAPQLIYASYTLAHSYLWRADENKPWGPEAAVYNADAGTPRYRDRPQRLGFFSRPAETSMIIDSPQPVPGWTTAWSAYSVYKFWVSGSGPAPAHVELNAPPNQPESVWKKATFPHLNATDMLHYDGHVKATLLGEMRAGAWMGYWGN